MKKDARKTTALPYQRPSGLSMVNAVTQVVTEAEENVKAGKLADKPVMIAQCDDPLSELMTIDDLHIDWKPQITNGDGDPIADSSEEVKMAVCVRYIDCEFCRSGVLKRSAEKRIHL